MRLTNRKIIDELLPILRKAVSCFLSNLDSLDWEAPSWQTGIKRIAEEVIDGHIVEFLDFGDQIHISAMKSFDRGRFDYAQLTAVVSCSDNRVSPELRFAKEFKGMGNGFYAKVDWNGKIIYGEWD